MVNTCCFNVMLYLYNDNINFNAPGGKKPYGWEDYIYSYIELNKEQLQEELKNNIVILQLSGEVTNITGILCLENGEVEKVKINNYKFLKIKNGVYVDYEKLKNTVKELEQYNKNIAFLNECVEDYRIYITPPLNYEIEYYNLFFHNLEEYNSLKRKAENNNYKIIPLSKLKKYY